MKQVTVNIDDKILKHFRTAASDRNDTAKVVFRTAIEDAICDFITKYHKDTWNLRDTNAEK